MTKLKNPLMSLKATGGFSKLFSLAKRRGRHIIERRPIPTDAKSPAQLFSRHMFSKCVNLWHLLSSAEQQQWESLARPRHMSGYAWFVSQCLRPNPGIYLPLQGGTMSGDIDMAKHRLLKLPNPTDDQEAAHKKYVDDLAPGLHAATHENGGADEINIVGLSGLLAEDQHVLDAEAVSAMGAKGDANPLHHDRYADAEAAAIAAALIAIHAALPNVHHAPPAAGAVLVVAETEVYNAVAPQAWTDLDLSGTIGAQATLVLLKVKHSASTSWYAFRKDGDTDEFYHLAVNAKGCALADVSTGISTVFIVATADTGKIEWKCERAQATTVDIIAYIK